MKLALCTLLVLAALAAPAAAQKAAASHILVKDEAKCSELKTQLDKETTPAGISKVFTELAKEHSTCPSGKSGGSLGEFSPGQMVKEFNDVIFDTGSVGKVEGPVKTQFGYHLILITSRGDDKVEL